MKLKNLPDSNILLNEINSNTLIEIGNKYNVSPNTIVTRIKQQYKNFDGNKFYRFSISPDILLDELKIFTLEQLSKKYNKSPQTISRRIKTKYPEFNHCFKYTMNEEFFSKIDTEEKAYWLGFIYADGYINNIGTYSLNITLSIIDEPHLSKFKQNIFYTGDIKKYKNNSICCISLNRKKIVENLIKLGAVKCKSLILTFPTEEQVPKKLIKHFIRGYFDGDGCLHFAGYEKSITFVGTESFLVDLIKMANDIINIPIKKVRKVSKGKIYVFTYKNKNDMLNFLDWIYTDCKVYLDRKHQKYLEFKNFIANKENLKIIKSKCQYPNCENKYCAKGYCSHHYRKFKKGTL